MKTKWVRIGMFLVLAAGISLAIFYRGDIAAEKEKSHKQDASFTHGRY